MTSYIPLYKRYSLAPEGWQEQDSELYYEFTLAPNQSKLANVLKDGFGNQLDDVNALFENVAARVGALSAPVFPELPVLRNGYLLLDLIEYLGSTTQVSLLLTGVTRWQG